MYAYAFQMRWGLGLSLTLRGFVRQLKLSTDARCDTKERGGRDFQFFVAFLFSLSPRKATKLQPKPTYLYCVS
jgi:hypothetical protein